MNESEPLQVFWSPQAERPDWMAGMELPWPHRALIRWQPVDPDGNGPGATLRRALWQALSQEDARIGVPVLSGTRPKGLFGWLFGQPRRGDFTMNWEGTFAAFDALLDESLYFAAAFDPEAVRPDAKALAVWHDQGAAPASLFPPGQRTILRSGVDGFCLGVFCRDETELGAFRRALADALALAGGALSDVPEPPRR